MLASQRARRAASVLLALVILSGFALTQHPGDRAAAAPTTTTASLAEEYVGTGIWLRQDPEGRVIVGALAPDSPGATAGVRVGEQLLAVDGATVGRRLTQAAASLRGAPGTKVDLLLDSGASQRRVVVSRAVMPASVSTTDLVPGVVMLRIPEFSRGISTALDEALGQRTEAKALVLDLRGNPGGLLEEAVAVAGRFLDGGAVVRLRPESGGERLLSAQPGGEVDRPLVLLVDRGTASSAEIVTAALQDRGRAVVVGSSTFGKGTVQESVLQPDGSRVARTVAEYLTPSGQSVDGTGVTPDVLVGAGAAAATAEERALDVVVALTAALAGQGES